MPNHIHLIVTPRENSSIARVMQLIKGGSSHALREAGPKLNAVWQQRYHERRIRDFEELANFARYIRENPVRMGLANFASEYPYSSAAAVVRLDVYPGLKPLGSKATGDADLKVGSTEHQDSLTLA